MYEKRTKIIEKIMDSSYTADKEFWRQNSMCKLTVKCFAFAG